MQSNEQSATERFKRILNLLLSPFLSPSFWMAVLIIGAIGATWGISSAPAHERDRYGEVVHKQMAAHSEKSPEMKWVIEAYVNCVYQEKPKLLFEKVWNVCRQPILLRGEIRGAGKEVDTAILAFHAGVAESVKNAGLRIADGPAIFK